jgi:hypothetical protein
MVRKAKMSQEALAKLGADALAALLLAEAVRNRQVRRPSLTLDLQHLLGARLPLIPQAHVNAEAVNVFTPLYVDTSIA